MRKTADRRRGTGRAVAMTSAVGAAARAAVADVLERRVLLSSSVAVTVNLDPNQNGTSTSPLAGQQVFADLNGDGTLEAGEPTAITGANGKATLSLAGATGSTVLVGELMPDGYAQTSPATAEASVSVASPAALTFGVLKLTTSGSADPNGNFTHYAFSNLTNGQLVTNGVTQPDGKLVVIGSDSGGTFVARYFADGQPDLRFGTNGIVDHTGHLQGAYPQGLAVTPAGDVVVATGTSNAVAVSALLPTGVVDGHFTAWTAGGSASNDYTVAGLALMVDGSLLVSGGISVNGDVAAFATDLSASTGAVNAGFGSGGTALGEMGGGSSILAPAVVNPSGGFDIVGYTENDPQMFAFSAAGQLLTTAIVPVNEQLPANDTDSGDPFNPDFRPTAVAVQPDGNLVIAGAALSPKSEQSGDRDRLEIVLARVSGTGVLDAHFGAGGAGVVIEDNGGASYFGSITISAATVLSNGVIVVTAATSYTQIVFDPDTGEDTFPETNQCNCQEFDAAGTALLGYSTGGSGTSNELNVDADGNAEAPAPLALRSGVLPAVTAGSAAVVDSGVAVPLAIHYGGVGFTGATAPSMLTGQGTADVVVQKTGPTVAGTTASPASITANGSTTPAVVKLHLTDPVSVNVATLGTGDVTVKLPNGSTALATFTGVEAGGSPLDLIADYTVAPVGGTWDFTDDGTYTLALLANQIRNTGAAARAVASLTSFTVAVPATPPTAALAAVPTVTAAGTGSVTLTVTYTGSDAAIKAASIDKADLAVTGAKGTTLAVTGATVGTASGKSLPVTYTVAAPAGGFTPTANDTYTVRLVASQVTDGNGTAAAAATLGTFTVNVSATAPTVSLGTVPSVTAVGTAPVSFVVTYTGTSAPIQASTIGTADLTVATPSGKRLSVTGAAAGTASGNALPVTYTVSPPAGGWTSVANGTYTITLVAGQVTDTLGTAAAGASLGSLVVNVPAQAPTARLAAVPTVTAAGTTSVTLTVTYTGATATILASTIGTADLTVTGANGTTLTVTAATPGTASGQVQPVTYTVAAPAGGFVPSGNTTYTVKLVANQVTDANGTPAAAATLGTFAVNVSATAPSAALAAVPSVTTAGTAPVTLTITYTGTAAAIQASTIGTADLTVTGPGGRTLTVTTATASTASGNVLPVTYTVAAPAGGWSSAANGSYTVALVSGQVTDTLGTAATAATLGTFTVAVAARPPTAVLSTVPPVTGAGTTSVTLVVTYTGSGYAILGTTIGTGDLTVTGPAGALSVTAATAGAASGNTLAVTYTVAAPAGGFTTAANGTYSVALAANQVTDVAGTVATAAVLGSITVNVPAGTVLAPTAALAAVPTVTAADATPVTLTVTYTGSAAAILATTIGTDDLTVVGSTTGTALSVTAATAGTASGKSLAVTYTVAAPTGGWSSAANDTYVVTLVANQVTDTAGTAAGAATLGSFTVAVAAPDTTPPTARLASAPSVTADGVTLIAVVVTYADDTAVSVATVGTDDITVTGPDGVTQLAVTAASADVSIDAASVIVTYTVAAPATEAGFATGDNGAYTVAVAAGGVTDTSGNAVAGGTLGTFAVAIGAPSAALAPVPDVTVAGTSTVALTITYTGTTAAIDPATVGTDDLIVTGPDGSTTLAVADAEAGAADGNALAVTYTVAAPSASGFAVGDDGTYTVALAAGQVADLSGTGAPGATLGTFAVALSTATPTPTATVPTVALTLSATTIQAGNFLTFTVAVTGTGPTPTGSVSFLDGTAVVGTGTLDGTGSATFATAALSAGLHAVTVSYAGDATFAAEQSAPIAVTVTAPLPTDPALTPVITGAKVPGAVVAGAKAKVVVPVVVTNTGAATERGTVTVALYASTNTSLDTGDPALVAKPFRVTLKAGARKTFTMTLPSLPASLGDGTFYILAQVTDAAGFAQVVATPTTVTVAAPFVAPSVSFTKVKLPSPISGGGRTPGTVVLTLGNAGNVAINGAVTVTLLLTTDGTAGTAVGTLQAVVKRLTVPAGKSKPVSVAVKFAPVVAAGTYFLTAVVDTPATNGAAAATASAGGTSEVTVV